MKGRAETFSQFSSENHKVAAFSESETGLSGVWLVWFKSAFVTNVIAKGCKEKLWILNIVFIEFN